jgi:protein TonB
VHGILAAFLVILPAEARKQLLGAVDFTVQKKAPEPPEREPPPEKKTLPDEPEPERIKVPRPRPAVPRPVEEPPPEQAPPPKPPPKFQMSGKTFAGDGSWSVAADVGDSRFGSLGGEGTYEKKAEDKPPAVAATGTGEGKGPKAGFSPASPGKVKDKPKVLMEQQIPYPPEARKLGIEGKVRLRVDIDRKGRVVKVQIIQDPGGGLGQAAAKALKSFVFSPAIGLDGKPVDYRITYTYVFTLE